jgi:ATP phosphoribosyltransferase
MSLTLALSKGKLLAGAEALFRRAGVPFPADEGRRLVVSLDGVRFLFVRDADVPT